MSPSRRLPLAVLVLSACVSVHATALAEGAFVGHDRRVSGRTFVTTPEDFDTGIQDFVAPDEGPFDATSFVSTILPGASSVVTCIQTSTVTPVAIHATGSVDAIAQLDVEGGTAYAAGQSSVALRFVVPEATTYELHGFVEAFEDGYTSFALSRPFFTVEYFNATATHHDLDASGVLEAGTYDFNVTSSFGVSADPGAPVHPTGAYELNLVLGSATSAVPVVAGTRLIAAPNPFSARTRLVLPGNAREVRIIDLSGRLVRTLTGDGSLTWDGRDDAGRDLAAGVYWARPVGSADASLKIVRVR